MNGAGAEAFWGQAAPHASAQHMHHQNKMGVGGPGNSAGWEEPSPPSQRRNMPNYDDGTSLWGNPQQGNKEYSFFFLSTFLTLKFFARKFKWTYNFLAIFSS